MCVSLLVPVCLACLLVSVISNQSTSKNHAICVKPSVNSMPCCIKHTARRYYYKGTKAQQVWVHNIMKQNNTLDVVP